MNIKTIIFFVNYAPRFQNFDSLTDQTRRPKEGDQYSQRPEALIIVRQKKKYIYPLKDGWQPLRFPSSPRIVS